MNHKQLIQSHGVLTSGATVAPSYSYVIDDIASTPLFAWSPWQLSSTVTNCIRLRRSSDNAEQDFGFVNNYIDTAGIASWLGADTGYIKIFYDASGNSNDATETATAEQFIYGATTGVDGQMGARARGTDIVSYSFPGSPGTQTNCTTIVTGISDTDSVSNRVFSTASNRAWFIQSSSYLTSPNLSSTASIAVTDAEDFLFILTATAALDVYMQVNNDSTTGVMGGDNTRNLDALFDVTSSDFYFNGGMIFNSVISTDDITAIKSWYNNQWNKSIT